MIRLHIVAEGQTEEEFIKSVLTGHLGNFNISTDVHCITTKRTKKKVYRGGAVSYGKIQKDIMLWLKQDSSQEARFTTMLDLYALPNDFPEFAESQNKSDPYQKVEQLEAAWANDINDPRFIPYIQLHEFEALILSEPSQFSERFPEYQVNIKKLLADCEKFTSPELINDGVTTAPSKRINKFIPGYKDAKVSVAPLIAKKIGLPAIRQKCPHFDAWISHLEQLR